MGLGLDNIKKKLFYLEEIKIKFKIFLFKNFKSFIKKGIFINIKNKINFNKSIIICK